MPAQFSFYSDKNSETVLSTTTSGSSTYTSVISANLLASASSSTPIGSLIVTKSNVTDPSNNIWATFKWCFKFNNSNAISVPPNELVAVYEFFNQTTAGSNPSENIPAGGSGTFTGSINNASSGEYQNQFGYVIKTKDQSAFRRYDVYFPQLVANYTNVFNSLPQPNVAPLA
jgi:hypothetical protein